MVRGTALARGAVDPCCGGWAGETTPERQSGPEGTHDEERPLSPHDVSFRWPFRVPPNPRPSVRGRRSSGSERPRRAGSTAAGDAPLEGVPRGRRTEPHSQLLPRSDCDVVAEAENRRVPGSVVPQPQIPRSDEPVGIAPGRDAKSARSTAMLGAPATGGCMTRVMTPRPPPIGGVQECHQVIPPLPIIAKPKTRRGSARLPPPPDVHRRTPPPPSWVYSSARSFRYSSSDSSPRASLSSRILLAGSSLLPGRIAATTAQRAAPNTNSHRIHPKPHAP